MVGSPSHACGSSRGATYITMHVCACSNVRIPTHSRATPSTILTYFTDFLLFYLPYNRIRYIVESLVRACSIVQPYPHIHGPRPAPLLLMLLVFGFHASSLSPPSAGGPVLPIQGPGDPSTKRVLRPPPQKPLVFPSPQSPSYPPHHRVHILPPGFTTPPP